MQEIIKEVCLNEDGELFLLLEGEGKSSYQYIYREAVGIYWDSSAKAFKSTELKDWSCTKWFTHIVETLKNTMDLKLVLSPDVIWQNVPQLDIDDIRKLYAI